MLEKERTKEGKSKGDRGERMLAVSLPDIQVNIN